MSVGHWEEAMTEVDWSSLFLPTGSLVEIAVRGTVVYLALFLTMRFLPRREIGGMGPADILVIVLIADAVQNAMAGGYESITEGLALGAVIFFWARFIDWLDFRFPDLHIAGAAPMLLVKNGRLMRRNMAREQITEDEVLEQLRIHGLESPRGVKAAYVEGDGQLSVLLQNAKAQAPPLDPKGT
jgi:uncharacterized membrane protein YcaP (DUF421 family)